MSSVKGRLARLAADNRNKRCAECGHGGDARVEYEVEWVEENTSADAPEFCPACGRQLSYVVTWPDDERK